VIKIGRTSPYCIKSNLACACIVFAQDTCTVSRSILELKERSYYFYPPVPKNVVRPMWENISFFNSHDA